jgi:hypothetical protein
MIGENSDLLVSDVTIAWSKLMQHISQFTCAFFGVATTTKKRQQLARWERVEMLFML